MSDNNAAKRHAEVVKTNSGRSHVGLEPFIELAIEFPQGGVRYIAAADKVCPSVK